MSSGLKITLISPIFFMSLSVQVSYSVNVLELIAGPSNAAPDPMCCCESLS